MRSDDPFEAFDVEVETDDLPPDVEALVEAVDRPEEGFFGPGTMTWRVNRENAVLLAGVSAVLLQLGHPLVAAGIADHSDFDADPAGRFQRTFAIVDNVVFGDVETAVEAALTVRRLHSRVTGGMTEAVGPYEAGATYDANDPDLLLWVWATLVDQVLVAYETYVEELSDAEHEAYYRESKVFGQLMGVPADAFPATLADFYEYYERELETTVATGDRATELKETLFDQFAVLGPLSPFFGAATMPDPCREAFGLPWSERHQRVFEVVASGVRRLLPYLPARIRYDDHYRESARRLGSPLHADSTAVGRPWSSRR